jgi:hypothetical protein
MNIWKLTTLALALLLVVVVGGGTRVRSAGAENQPAMESALGHLEAAKAKLKDATSDKGGHRVKAIELTDLAIEQVRKGIAHDNRRKAR